MPRRQQDPAQAEAAGATGLNGGNPDEKWDRFKSGWGKKENRKVNSVR
jgi:hypothetical protein